MNYIYQIKVALVKVNITRKWLAEKLNINSTFLLRCHASSTLAELYSLKKKLELIKSQGTILFVSE